jgi:hypothetical protein
LAARFLAAGFFTAFFFAFAFTAALAICVFLLSLFSLGSNQFELENTEQILVIC